MSANGPPNKRAKFGSDILHRFTFSNTHDIKNVLQTTQDPNVLSKALSALRSKLSLKPGEMLAPNDERLSLAKLWMESSPAAHDLFDVWGRVNEALVTSLFSSLLSLFSYHLPDHSYGIPIIKMLLSPQWLQRLKSYVSGSHNEQILATLKLFNAMSTFGSGRERKLVFEAFPWDSKGLPKLLYMRRRGKGNEGDDFLVRPDIRMYYVLFILSMVDQDTVTSVKAAFLEQHREVFMSIFKGLVQDQYTVIQKVLQVCWEGIWLDPKIKRTTKLALFNEVTISHLLKLYDRAVAESLEGEHVPADIVHHFLLAICTHPGQGICFRDRGWYPRETDENGFANQEDIEGARQKGMHGGKIYNKILANVLRTLKVNEDLRQQELALKITAACPELVSGYWSAAKLTLDPRLSSKWIANICFAAQVLSLVVPVHSFLLPGSSVLYNPTPPPLSTIMGNVLPSVGTKTLFTKGLQASLTPIVQHCTALALAKCLQKLAEVVRVFKLVETALEEDREEGQWNRQRKEVEKEARRRVPEFQVIVAFSQQTLATASSNTTKHALLSEGSQRLLWLYQEYLPDVVAEARFEVGKLVLNLVEGSFASLSGDYEDELMKQEDQPKEASAALQSVKHLHVLRLLRGSDQFAWAGKVASSSHTYLYVLLKTFCNSRVRALHTTLRELLQHALSETVLFQEDSNEVEIWLAALPFHVARRGQGTEAPDGAPLTDEVDAIVTFLDDCAQRCFKTPYRYIEAMSTLIQSSTSIPDIRQEELSASPLLMTVLEQVTAKVSGQLMTPSDMLAIFTFVRRLLVMLAAKQDDSKYQNLFAILDQLDSSVDARHPFPNNPSICFGIRRELSIARTCLCHLRDDDSPHVIEGPSHKMIATFLDRIEQVPVREPNPRFVKLIALLITSHYLFPEAPSESARMTSAFELVDWLRLSDVKPSPTDISRLASVIRRFYEPAVSAVVDYLHPSSGLLWDSEIVNLLPGWPSVDGVFGWLYFHCTLRQFQDRRTRGVLLTALYTHPVTLNRLKHAIRLVTHGIAISMRRHDLTAALLSLLSDVLRRAQGNLCEQDLRRLKGTIIQCGTIQGLCVSQGLADNVHKAIRELLLQSFDPADAEDQSLLTSIGSHWAEMVTSSLSSGQLDDLKYAQPWVQFMGTEGLLAVVDLIQTNTGKPNATACDILKDILGTLQHRTSRDSIPMIAVPKLLGLQCVLPGCTLLEDMLSAALVSQLPLGVDGQITFAEGQSLSSILCRTRPTHLSDLRSLPFSFISRLLEKESWTDSTASAIVALLYSNSTSMQAYATWLNNQRWTQIGTQTFALVLVAFLECKMLMGGDLSEVNNDVLHGLLNHLFLGERHHDSSRARHLECIQKILELSGTRRTQLVYALQERLQGIPIMDFAFETTFLAGKILGVSDCGALTTNIVDRALQWAVRHLSSDATELEDSRMALENLKHVITQLETLKSHLVEPLLTTIVQRHLSDAGLLDFAVVLASKTPFQPVVVNRLLQNVLQHQQFVAVCGRHGSAPRRNQITRLLDALFRLHPANTCQPSHIELLFQVYGGTMSSPDRRLLSIMRLFEAERRTSLSPFFSRWSPSPDVIVSTPLEVVQNFDPVYMLRTCLAFPSWRRFEDEKCMRDGPTDAMMYDPLMVIVLSAQTLVECPPVTQLGWVKFFRSNVGSLLIRCLSSKDPNIRETALCQIASLWGSVQTSNMHETPQVIYVFRLLKHAMNPPPNSDDPPRRLPTFTTLIILHALRGIFYPSNFIYPRTARFLLQRPELDLSDVPMLFGMLYSSSDDWKKERGWMLRMLADGMASTGDWNVLKRRHTWDLVATLFQSSKNEATVRAGILEILANLTCNPQACTSLVLKSSLLSWIDMQVADNQGGMSMAWLRILENVLVVADTSKLARATGDQWCLTICRCLCSLLRDRGTDKEVAILQQGAAVVLRVSLIPGIPGHSLRSVLSRAVEYLQHLEPAIHLHRLRQPIDRNPLPQPPHHAQGLLDVPTMDEPVRGWGEIVETLWRVSMSLEDDDRTHVHAWAMLTTRLVVWRALVGEEASRTGEWARKEALLALRDAT